MVDEWQVSGDPKRPTVIQRHPNGLIPAQPGIETRVAPLKGPATIKREYLCACGSVYVVERPAQ